MPEKTKADMEDHIAITFADSAILAALLALAVKDASDKEAALDAVRKWVDNGLKSVISADNLPGSLREKVAGRVAGVFDIAKHFKTP